MCIWSDRLVQSSSIQTYLKLLVPNPTVIAWTLSRGLLMADLITYRVVHLSVDISLLFLVVCRQIIFFNNWHHSRTNISSFNADVFFLSVENGIQDVKIEQ